MRRILLSVLAGALVVAGAFSLSLTGAFAQGCAGTTATNSAKASSWVGGGQVGYNWQQGAVVYGVESDLAGTHLKSSMSGPVGTPGNGCTASTSSLIDWYGTVRGRAGWAAGNVLVYGTGGLAYGHVGINSVLNTLGALNVAESSVVRAGWVAGAGVEYLVQPNWIFNVGYQYVDLGTASASSTAAASTQTVNSRAAFHVVSAGFSWRFSPAPMGSWSGGYLGGHGGGDWGNKTSATYTGL